MGDLDLLVQRTDLERSAARLQELGYASDGCPDIDAYCEKVNHLPAFVRPGATSIEVHWAIEDPTCPFKIDIGGLWERARPAVIAGVETLVLCTRICFCTSASTPAIIIGGSFLD